jgi:hypothetical protein
VKSELVKPAHLARRAVVYIRQSTPHQVVSNQESLRLQYALRQRAHELGWHEADIDVMRTGRAGSGDIKLATHDVTQKRTGGESILAVIRPQAHFVFHMSDMDEETVRCSFSRSNQFVDLPLALFM